VTGRSGGTDAFLRSRWSWRPTSRKRTCLTCAANHDGPIDPNAEARGVLKVLLFGRKASGHGMPEFCHFHNGAGGMRFGPIVGGQCAGLRISAVHRADLFAACVRPLVLVEQRASGSAALCQSCGELEPRHASSHLDRWRGFCAGDEHAHRVCPELAALGESFFGARRRCAGCRWGWLGQPGSWTTVPTAAPLVAQNPDRWLDAPSSLPMRPGWRRCAAQAQMMTASARILAFLPRSFGLTLGLGGVHSGPR